MKIHSLNKANYTGMKSGVKNLKEEGIKDEISLGASTETPDFLKDLEGLKSGKKEAMALLGIGGLICGTLYGAMHGSVFVMVASVFGGAAFLALTQDE